MNTLRLTLARAMDDHTWRHDPRWRRIGLGVMAAVFAAWLVAFGAVLDTAQAKGEVVRNALRPPR